MGTAKLPTRKTEDWDVMFADWLDRFAMAGCDQAVTACLWRCPPLRRPYSKTFPRTKRRIRACNRFQPPGTTSPKLRARPCANGLVDVSSLQDVRTPASSSSAAGAASVGSFGSGASALLDLSAEPPRTKTSLQQPNAASTAALLCTFARLVSMLELKCITPTPLRPTTRRCAPRRRRQLSRYILGRAEIGQPAKLFEAKTHRRLSYELGVPRRLQRRCGKKHASWLWDTRCRNVTEQLEGGPVCSGPCLKFVATIASLSVPPIARLDNANCSPKGCLWRPLSGNDCTPSSNRSARQRLQRLIHRAHGEKSHHALHRETVSAEPRLVCDNTLDARASLAAQPPMAHDAFNWLDQLPSLVGRRPHHFDPTRTADIIHLPRWGLEHPSTPGLSPEPR